MQTFKDKDFPTEDAGTLLTILLFFMALLLYSILFREIYGIVSMPDLDDEIIEVIPYQIKRHSLMILKSGITTKIPDRLAYLAEPGMKIVHKAQSFSTQLNGRKIRIFRITPMVIFALSFIVWIFTSLNNFTMGEIIRFTFANRIGRLSIAHLLLPAIFLIAFLLPF